MPPIQVKRYNYAAQFGDRLPELCSEIQEILTSGSYVLSHHVDEFEKAFSSYTGTNHAIGVNSGTDALLLSLLALDLPEGAEVITQANTFHATVAAICRSGAKPVLVDTTNDSYEFNHSQLSSVATENTAAIIPVHLFGYPTSLDGITQDAKKHGWYVIEDAAQAHGARLDGKVVGSFGDLGCFSFHPSKNLAAAGDAGAIVTDNNELAKKLDSLRSLGQASQNDHVLIGLNSKLDAIQAAVLNCKIAYLDDWNHRRAKLAAIYQEQLQNLPIGFQSGKNQHAHVYHLFQIRVSERDRLLAHLKAHDIDAVVRYPIPIHLQPAFHQFGWKSGQFPIAEALASELLCLPLRPDMGTEEIDRTCEVIAQFYG